MQLLKLVRRRSFLSEVVYTVLNVGFALALVAAIYYTDSVGLSLLIVLLSKWRILAVRPRYWYANFLSNLVDIIVSISFVIIMYTLVQSAAIVTGQTVALLALGTVLYIVWLLVIKPRSKRSFMVAQAGTAIVLGTWALFTISFNWPVSIVVIGMWLIGYSVARHALSSYDEETHSLLLGLVWGLVLSEIGWIGYHWAVAYSLPFVNGLLLPQISIISVLASFLAYKCYDSFAHHQKIRVSDIILPLLFTVSAVVLLLVVFNRVGTAF